MSTPEAPVGLSRQEAAQRLHVHGPNQIEDARPHGVLHTLKVMGSEPMFLMMLLAAGIYLVLGDLGEGALLTFFALVSLGLIFFQERRSARALDALRSLSAPTVRVLRDGQPQRIAARELVPGDVMLVSEGERLAADGRLLQTSHLAVDESLLTGESVPVNKSAKPPSPADDRVHAGTLVVAGHATVEVTATGSARTASLLALHWPRTPAQAPVTHRLQLWKQ